MMGSAHVCRIEGCSNPTDDGEGWDGMCGPCADRRFCVECEEMMDDEEAIECHDTSEGPVHAHCCQECNIVP